MHKTAASLCIGAFFLAAIPCGAQQTRLLSADKTNDYGVVYRLPVTGLSVVATATRTVETAGPFYQYASRFIGTDKVISADSERWVLEGLSVNSYGVADPDESYVLSAKPGVMTSVTVADDGMLLAINAPAEAPLRPDAFRPSAPQAAPSSIDEYLQYVDEDFLACQSSFKQAEMLASALMEIRDARISLTRGTAETMPTDGRQLELMLESLRHQEEAITRAFTGQSVSTTVSRQYTVVPEEEGESILFRLSDFAGFVDADDLSGDAVRLSLNMVTAPEIPLDSKGEEKKMPKDAVVYCIPATLNVSFTHKGRVIMQRDMEFAQFGITYGLQPSLFSDKKDLYQATFVPETGALRDLRKATQSQ